MNKQRAGDGLVILTAAILVAGVVTVLAQTGGIVGAATRVILAIMGVLTFTALAAAAIEVGLRELGG